MKKFIRLFTIILCLSLFAPTAIPFAGAENVQAAQKVKLNYTKKTIYEGDSFQLKVKGTKKKVKWSTSNKKVATVSSKGVVKGKSGGSDRRTCKITAAVGGKKYSCKVTVRALEEDEEDEVDDADDMEDDTDSDDSSEDDITDGDIPEDTAPVSTVEENLATLKNYIQKYGYVNPDGDRVIRETTGNFTTGIIYEKSTDSLNFMFVGESTADTIFEMTIGSPDNSSPLNVSMLWIAGSYGFKATSTISPSAFYKEAECYFMFTENVTPLSEGDIQSLCDSMLKAAFVGWEHLMKKSTGLMMKDIGFTSY